jgi:hypothetical protein
MRLEIRRVTAPTGQPAVLLQADEFHLLFWPHDALEIAETISEVARGIIADDS